MKYVTYNIQYSRGKDGQYNLRRIADELAGADVIALQEVECFWQRSGNISQSQSLAQQFPEYYWVYGAGVDLDASYRNNSGGIVNRRRQFGNMLLSRFPLLYSRNHLLPKYASTGPASIQRSALEAVIKPGDTAVRIYSIHLTHLTAETRFPQVERILQLHRDARLEGSPMNGQQQASEWIDAGLPIDMPEWAILSGDFNFQPDSEEYEYLVGPASPHGGRLKNPTGFVDAWAHSGHAQMEGITAEMHGQTIRLDYIFVSTLLADQIRSTNIDNKALGSDHQPVWMDIDL